ncbi:MAG: trigger factor [Alphaproteobacteria bacterium]|jgi:trigger factor|nr:trigger factor [Alphaproteobacteria bacterium]MDP7191434.1 trigger factor [Alphaproteobacteria bacterium]HJO88959.1 trigger factor [Alphaproteobacteria bacterium]|tara:strand:+ start:3490 stop:4902 length:1413 start_codon:yes stop_codon:yes gene_type:complete
MQTTEAQVTEVKSEGLSREFKVVVPAQELDRQLELRLQEIGRTAKIPGFRQGKVPVDMLKKRYASSVMGDILESTVSTSSQRAMEDRQLRPASQPKIEITSYEDGTDLEYNMVLEVMPEIPNLNLAELSLDRLYAEPDEEKVTEGLKELAMVHKRFEPAKASEKAKIGDQILFDYVGKIDGAVFDGGSGENEEIELGSGRFIPGYEEQMTDAAAGDELKVKVVFPETYHVPKVAGKTAVFDVSVKEVRKPIPIAVDDELAKDLDLENLAELRKMVTGRLEREYEEIARIRLKRVISDILVEKCRIDLPEGMVEDEFQSFWDKHEEARKADGEQAADKKDEEAKRAEIRVAAERRILLALVLAELGHRNNIKVEEAEVMKAMQAEAARYPGQEQQVISHYQQNPQMIQGFRTQIYEEKVLDFIVEMAEVTDRKVDLKELIALPNGSDVTKSTAKSKTKKKVVTQGKTTKKK